MWKFLGGGREQVDLPEEPKPKKSVVAATGWGPPGPKDPGYVEYQVKETIRELESKRTKLREEIREIDIEIDQCKRFLPPPTISDCVSGVALYDSLSELGGFGR